MKESPARRINSSTESESMQRIAWILSLVVAFPLSTVATSAFAQTSYASVRPLILSQRLLPAHYRYRGVQIQDSVADWDSNIKQVMAIDEQNGWIEGARETARDTRNRPVRVAVQLFRTNSGARADFNQFFTNSHPETIYNPSAEWLGGSSIGGFGRPATIYRYSDTGSGCPQGLVSGISYVYANALFSVEVCLHTAGEGGARDLARRLLQRARAVGK